MRTSLLSQSGVKTKAPWGVCLMMCFAGLALATGPDQDTHINQIYQATSRAQAIQAEANRDREVLAHIHKEENDILKSYYLRNGVCRDMKHPADTNCYRRNSADLQKSKLVIEKTRQEEETIHEHNIAAINNVWEQRAKWAAQAQLEADARARSQASPGPCPRCGK